MTARPERVAAGEVRQRMLDAGRDLALESGAALTIEHLRLEEVIQRARVPRSSVYRMWAYREAYIDDLLCYLAGEGSFFSDRPLSDPDTPGVAAKVVAAHPDLLATAGGRRALLCEVVRITAEHNYAELSGSPQWRLHMALVATLGSTRSGEARRRIALALEDSQLRSRESIVSLLTQLTGVLGMRLRDPAYTLDHLHLAGGLLVQAMALRNVQVQTVLPPPDGAARPGGVPFSGAPESSTPESDAPEAAPGPAAAVAGSPLEQPQYVDSLLNGAIPGPGLDGRPAPWTLVAYAYLALVDAFLEPDPDFTPGAGSAG